MTEEPRKLALAAVAICSLLVGVAAHATEIALEFDDPPAYAVGDDEDGFQFVRWSLDGLGVELHASGPGAGPDEYPSRFYLGLTCGYGLCLDYVATFSGAALSAVSVDFAGILDLSGQDAADPIVGIEIGDLGAAKDKLRTLWVERERPVRDLAQSRVNLPAVEDLMPRLREKLGDLEETLRADVARGRLALGGLLAERRLRIYSDGRIEGVAALGPETLIAPGKAQGRLASVVAGAGFEPATCGL